MALRPAVLVACWLAAASAAAAPAAPARGRPLNVILLLSDGTAPEAWALTRLVAGGRLAVDDVLTGAVRTYGADSVITDSAPGATAYATGFKGSDKAISVGAPRVTVDAARPHTAPAYAPVATLLEAARLQGRAVGLVATCQIQHATPAAFSAHVAHRESYADIAEQQVYLGMDVVLGGGLTWLLPEGVRSGERPDGEDLLQRVRARYAFVDTAQALSRARGPRVWGAFADLDLAYDVDRGRLAPAEPSLADMTRRAIELLSARRRGFFLFVEGSKVDWGAHANEPVAVVSELRAFDEAVRAALAFARADGHTLVVVVADHGTGGISVGTRDDHAYSTTDDDAVAAPLRRARLTASGLYRVLAAAGARTEQAVGAAVAEAWDLAPSPAELGELAAAVEAGLRLREQGRPVGEQEGAFVRAAAPLLSARARVGWTTGGHTGTDVFLFAYGPGRPTGLWDNAALGRWLARRMGLDLVATTRRLFVEAGPAFARAGLQTSLDRADPRNPVLVVARGGAPVARLPAFKNVLALGQREVELEGVVVLVHADGGDRVFVPRQAVDLVAAAAPGR